MWFKLLKIKNQINFALDYKKYFQKYQNKFINISY